MRPVQLRRDATAVYIPTSLIVAGVVGIMFIILILYFTQVSPSVYANGYEARIGFAIAIWLTLHSTVAVAAAEVPGVAVWPAKYVK